MKKEVIYLVIGVLLIIIGLTFILRFFNYPLKQPSKTTSLNLTQNNMNKKILMVIAFKDFRDEEYFVPKEILEKNGFIVETVSNKKGLAIGADGGEVEILKTVKEINPSDYKGVVFIGGPGMAKELDNEDFQKLAQVFYKENKLVSAICIAPALLAKAKILENKEATVWSSPLDKSAIQILKENSAIFKDELVVIDKNIITANGPKAATLFGEKIIDFFKKEQ